MTEKKCKLKTIEVYKLKRMCYIVNNKKIGVYNMRNEKLKMMLRTALFTALTAVGAFIKIPLGEISVTLQVMFSLMAGLILKEKWGALSQLLYVVIGLIGVPIFTQGGGLQYVFQPSFGFIIGLVPLAFISGLIAKKGGGFWRYAVAGVAGLAALYVIGLPYMHLILTLYMDKSVSIGYTLINGMLIFLPFDAIKIVIAAFTALKLRKTGTV